MVVAMAFTAMADGLTVKEGTEIVLTFDSDLSSKHNHEGDSISFTVREAIKVGEVVVIPAGAKAVGSIVEAEKSGMMGKPGSLHIRLDYVIANGPDGDKHVKLRGSKGREGNDAVVSTVALVVLLAVTFLNESVAVVSPS